MNIENWIKNCPKVELHAHLNGSLSLDTLQKLAAIKYGNSNNSRFKELYDEFNVTNFKEQTLTECFQKFKFAHELTSTPECLRQATMLTIKDFAEDNVIYLELRTTPKSSDILSKKEYLETVLEGVKMASQNYANILVKLLPSIDRSQGINVAEDTIQLVLELSKKDEFKDVIKGIDLSGNPEVGSFEEYKDLLKRTRDSGLKLALHCGEVENSKEIKEMLDFGMDRCGHGTFITEENLKILKEKRVPVECCLSSNVACGTVKDFNEHHFKDLFESCHPVVICTDDFGVFNSNLSSELLIASKTFSLSKDDIQRLTTNAVECSFATEDEKAELIKKIDNFYR